MPPFAPLEVEINSEGPGAGRLARLLRPYRLHVALKEKNLWVGYLNLPAGFKTDFASVPRAFWRILPPWGEYMLATVAHDFMYADGRWGRKAADRVFLHMMKRLGVEPWKRRVMYLAVRWFGGVAWNKFRRGQRPNDVANSPKAVVKKG